MPELPEVESVRLELVQHILGKRIMRAECNYPALVGRESLSLSLLADNSFRSVSRHGKYLLFCAENHILVAHLGMSGVLLYNKERAKHTHLILEFSDGTHLHFNDPRKFGYLALIPATNISSRIIHLGPDAVSRSFTKEYLYQELQKSSRDIKSILLDQSTVAGIGNIYASEVLFKARVSPLRIGKEISFAQAESIVKYTKETLKKSIENRGTTFSDYRLTDGKDGKFQTFLKVFHKEGQLCSKCHTTIEKIKQAGRSTFFCPQCQS